jgi:AGCS family alanine or glycine:cation symporter
MEMFEKFISAANAIIWSNALIFLLLAIGIYFSIRMRFFQVRLIKDMVKLLMDSDKSKAGISSFQALAVSLSGRVGTGNIAGVATAIFIGAWCSILDVGSSFFGCWFCFC